MHHPDLDEIARRPARYWTIDGLPELMLGVLWIVSGGAWLLGQQVPARWPWKAYWLIVAPALALGGFAANALTRALKRRVTFPRSGYVDWRPPDRRSRTRLAATIVVGAAMLAWAALSSRQPALEDRAPAVLSVIIALSFVAISIRQRTPHHLALAAAAVAFPVALASLTTGWDTTYWLFVALGAACALVGAIRLTRFVRSHPLPSPEGP